MTTAFFVHGGRDRRHWGVSVSTVLLCKYFQFSLFWCFTFISIGYMIITSNNNALGQKEMKMNKIKMNKKQAQVAAQAAADHAQDCHVVWVDLANNAWADPADHGCADTDWVCALKGDYPGAVSWTVVL